jgi:hypothetical protein
MWGLGLAVCFTLLSCCAVSLWLARREFRRIEHQIAEQIITFVSAPGDGGPSPLAMLVQLAGKTAGTEVAASLKGAFMGHSSSIAKAETALQTDMVLDSVEQQNPIVGMLLERFPRVAKRLARSPAALAALSNLDLGSLLKGVSGGGSPGNDGDVSARIGKRR